MNDHEQTLIRNLRNLRIEIETLKNEIKVLGMKQHENHTNTGINNRLEEWKNCKYTSCNRTYRLAYEKGEN